MDAGCANEAILGSLRTKVAPRSLPELDTDSEPPMQIGQLTRDGQSQPQAAVLPGHRAVGLTEAIENKRNELGSYADARVADGHQGITRPPPTDPP
jgi:hypothetical protein